jgi:hypothetical protein
MPNKSMNRSSDGYRLQWAMGGRRSSQRHLRLMSVEAIFVRKGEVLIGNGRAPARPTNGASDATAAALWA